MEDNFEPPAVIIEEIQEVAETPEEQASRAFVNIFYSLLHNIQNGKKGGVETLYQQRVKKMASFFHSEAWVSLQVTNFYSNRPRLISDSGESDSRNRYDNFRAGVERRLLF